MIVLQMTYDVSSRASLHYCSHAVHVCCRGTFSDVNSLSHGWTRLVACCCQSQKRTSRELPTSLADIRARGLWRRKSVCERFCCVI